MDAKARVLQSRAQWHSLRTPSRRLCGLEAWMAHLCAAKAHRAARDSDRPPRPVQMPLPQVSSAMNLLYSACLSGASQARCLALRGRDAAQEPGAGHQGRDPHGQRPCLGAVAHTEEGQPTAAHQHAEGQEPGFAEGVRQVPGQEGHCEGPRPGSPGSPGHSRRQ